MVQPDDPGAQEDGSSTSHNEEVTATVTSTSSGTFPTPRGTSAGGASSLASKIAAFSNGVAPVKSGLVDTAAEELVLVEEVIHMLEAAGRAPNAAGRCSLPLKIVEAAGKYLNTTKEEVARLEKELEEVKSSRVQLLPPSAWVKREHRYKMDLEKYENTIVMQQQQLKEMEEEMQKLLSGSNVRPLEERIAELEGQLKNTSEERTRYESKFHELSIKHRQLIETSPVVAAMWTDPTGQPDAAQQGQNEAVDRLTKVDSRHPSLGKGPLGSASLSMRVAVIKEAASRSNSRNNTGGGSDATRAAAWAGGSSASSEVGLHGGSSSTASSSSLEHATAEERAAAIMRSMAYEGMSPRASVSALQQLNADLTMQLGLYQTMVSRLKEHMEINDLEKAELEAEKLHLQHQLTQLGGGKGSEGGGRGISSWWRRGSRTRAAAAAAAAADNGAAGGHEGTEEGEWEGGTQAGDDTASVEGSFRSSPSMDLSDPAAMEAAAAAAANGHHHDTGPSPAAAAANAAAALTATTTTTGFGRFAGWGRRSTAGGNSPDALAKQLKEARHQATTASEDNKQLLARLVEVQMELAEAQGTNMQFKRALVRAMDREVELETKVRELQNMLDMLTCSPRTAGTAYARAGVSNPGFISDELIAQGGNMLGLSADSNLAAEEDAAVRALALEAREAGEVGEHKDGEQEQEQGQGQGADEEQELFEDAHGGVDGDDGVWEVVVDGNQPDHSGAAGAEAAVAAADTAAGSLPAEEGGAHLAAADGAAEVPPGSGSSSSTPQEVHTAATDRQAAAVAGSSHAAADAAAAGIGEAGAAYAEQHVPSTTSVMDAAGAHAATPAEMQAAVGGPQDTDLGVAAGGPAPAAAATTAAQAAAAPQQ